MAAMISLCCISPADGAEDKADVASPAAAAGEANSRMKRGEARSPQEVVGRLNEGSAEDWPEEEGLSTATVQEQKPSESDEHGGSVAAPDPLQKVLDHEAASAPVDTGVSGVARHESESLPPPESKEDEKAKKEAKEKAPEEQEKPNVVYRDENGNEVPKPPEPDKMLAEAESFLNEGQFDNALLVLDKIRAIPDVSKEVRERLLYDTSDCYWGKYASNPLAGYDIIVSSTNEALNADLRSPRAPEAMLRLGMVEIGVGNLAEAKGYVMALFRRYPDFPGVPQGFAALGKAQLDKGRDAEAEQSFSLVVDKYPDSAQLKDAAIGLVKALYRQKKFDKIRPYIEYVNKRWSRYYLDDPDFLLLQAEIDAALGKSDKELETIWLLYNVDPARKDVEQLFLKMAGLYLTAGNAEAAAFLYKEILERYPDTPGAVIAKLRIAEGGRYESPLDYARMAGMFEQRGRDGLLQVYKDTAATSQTDAEAVLARLKIAMWLYWDKEYIEAMGQAADFIDAYPEHPDKERANDIIWQSFLKELENGMAEQNYGRILILWKGFPLVRQRYGEPDARLRYALAQGWLERGNSDEALRLLSGFIKPEMDPQYGEFAFSEVFDRYIADGEWQKLLDLGKTVAGWKMQPRLRNQLDYAMALSAQNLGMTKAALEMWRNLAGQKDAPLYQRAYASYFLARDAEERKDIRSAYQANRDVVELFSQLQEEHSDKADPDRIRDAMVSLMDICEVSNRLPEALDWANRYRQFAPEGSDAYSALRFREARLYRKLGDSDRARALLEEVAKLAPDSPYGKAAASELHTFEVSRDLENYQNQQKQGS